ncbi:dihydrofolate reductase family protein [Gordonia sp. (in: high G+C Gram-positive bacteria)]|uniref:dihydrofolate reductase family protein n=1 Tax=Gordonia sp. (in: high G+C Gram-positive bacteria) TaxID=84139 RepID=UPI003C7146D4
MFTLTKATDVTTGDLAEAYRFPDSDRPVVRANMVTSLDGSSAADGKSGPLGSANDNAIFHLQRALADVIVVGAQTAIDEGYRPPTVDPRFADLRLSLGLSPVPQLILVSRSLRIPADYPTLASPLVRVATCTDSPANARRALIEDGQATLLYCGEKTVDLHLLIDRIANDGGRRILCEGGPRFLAEMTSVGLLDELALTVSPALVGGDGPRIAHGARLSPPAAMRIRHVMGDDDGFLYQLWERVAGHVVSGSD